MKRLFITLFGGVNLLVYIITFFIAFSRLLQILHIIYSYITILYLKYTFEAILLPKQYHGNFKKKSTEVCQNTIQYI